MAAVRRAQGDSKQQVRKNLGMKLIRMNLGMKLIFRKYIYLIQFIQIGVVKYTSTFQK